jgi:hypothetical protein
MLADCALAEVAKDWVFLDKRHVDFRADHRCILGNLRKDIISLSVELRLPLATRTCDTLTLPARLSTARDVFPELLVGLMREVGWILLEAIQ